MVEELYRLHAPAPDDHDWADSPGFSDSYIDPDELGDEVERLSRGELLLTGRTLQIAWLDGEAAEAILQRYFAESRYAPP